MSTVINSLTELANYVNAQPKTVYLRYSQGAAKDIKTGCSCNWAGGGSENGLSFVTLRKQADDESALQYIDYLAYKCSLYNRQVGQNGEHGWIATGERVGTGSDNEPLLYAETISNVVRISRACSNQVEDFNLVRVVDCETWEAKNSPVVFAKRVTRVAKVIAAL